MPVFHWFLTVCVLLYCNRGISQNLVPNGDFEIYTDCPDTGKIGPIRDVPPWTEAPAYGKSYFFNACAPRLPGSSVASVPNNLLGYEFPHSGNGYAGFITYAFCLNPFENCLDDIIAKRGCLRVELTSPLIAGRSYSFQMYESLAEGHAIYATNLEVYFSADLNFDPNATPEVGISLPVVTNESGWTQVSGTYVAKGGEKFLTIANYQEKPVLITLKIGLPHMFYYIDDVSLHECIPFQLTQPLLPDSIVLCNFKHPLMVSQEGISYLWSTGDTTRAIQIMQPDTYSVRIIPGQGYCELRDTVIVKRISPAFNFDLGPDKTICEGGTVTIGTQPPNNLPFLWSTGSTNVFITVDTGTYWMEVDDSADCIVRDSINVNYSLVNLVNLGADLNVCEGTSAVLNGYVPEATKYLWSTSETSPSISVSQSGTYIVEVQDSFCKDLDTINVTFNPAFSIDLGRDTTLCRPDSILLNTHVPGASYIWNTGQTGSAMYVSNTGIYVVVAQRLGCRAFDSIIVQVQSRPVIDLGNDTILCQGGYIRLSARTTGASYLWNTGSIDSVVTTPNSGKYRVEVTRGVCKVSDSVNVFHQPKPTLDLGADTMLCTGQSITLKAPPADQYLWYNGTMQNTSGVQTSGIYWVQIKKGVCTVRDSIKIGYNPIPIISLGNDSTLCEENTITLDAGNTGASFLWNDHQTTQGIVATPPGVFSVSVTNSFGCTSGDSIVLDTFTSPVVLLGEDTFVCEGSNLILDAGDAEAYLWQDGRTGSRYEATGAGMYAVTVKNAHQCQASDSIVLQVKPKPFINASREIKACNPDFELSLPDDYAAYQWQDGSTSATYHITDYGMYAVTVTDRNYCSNTENISVVNRCPGTVFIPNAFTPLNNDGVNDVFYPVARNVKSIHFQVYNRWGQLIFETTELNKGWTGIHKNEYSLSDVYVYKVIYTGMDDHTKMMSGDFTLLK